MLLCYGSTTGLMSLLVRGHKSDKEAMKKHNYYNYNVKLSSHISSGYSSVHEEGLFKICCSGGMSFELQVLEIST